jgi:DNA-binding response OmpR family regulator
MARTILVVEDDATLRETLVDVLEAESFRIVAAADGRAALAVQPARGLGAHPGPVPALRPAPRAGLGRLLRNGETRTVDVHIHWLRSTLEDDAASPQFVHTVRGVGYVFRRPAAI